MFCAVVLFDYLCITCYVMWGGGARLTQAFQGMFMEHVLCFRLWVYVGLGFAFLVCFVWYVYLSLGYCICVESIGCGSFCVVLSIRVCWLFRFCFSLILLCDGSNLGRLVVVYAVMLGWGWCWFSVQIGGLVV